MSLSSSILPFLPDTDPATTAKRWGDWIQSLEFYFEAAEITTESKKRAQLLHFLGPAAQAIYTSCIKPVLASASPPAVETYTNIKQELTAHFTPNINVDFEVYRFRQARQNQGESMDQYAVRLRSLGANCSFANIDSEIKSHIIA